MAAPPSSSSSAFLSARDERQNQMPQLQIPLAAQVSDHRQPPPANPSNKRRRNQAGNPNPDAEVIALSPKTLMATNRFVCEVCNKGFQREQNLQLHRRGHNLPWKLKQKSTKEVRRKVYLCPEPTCVHHDPARALGDLTGIKKHYSRKHGEKKYKCEKCSKKYAVQSDWKAHSKICGTREYRCDCGTLFSRRDSFITHRAFCDALAHESARNHNPSSMATIGSHLLGLSQLPSSGLHDQPDMLRLSGSSRTDSQFESLLSPGSVFLQPQGGSLEDHQSQLQSCDPHAPLMMPNKPSSQINNIPQGLMQLPQLHLHMNMNNASTSSGLFNLGFFSGSGANQHSGTTNDPTLFSSGTLMTNTIPSLYNTSSNPIARGSMAAAHMSATALLQRAAEMGPATSTNNDSINASSLLLMKSFGKSPSSDGNNNNDVGFGGISHLQNVMKYNAINNQAMEEEYNRMIRFQGNDGIKNSNNNSNINSAGQTRDFLGVGEVVRSHVRDQHEQQQNGLDVMTSGKNSGFESSRNFQ